MFEYVSLSVSTVLIPVWWTWGVLCWGDRLTAGFADVLRHLVCVIVFIFYLVCFLLQWVMKKWYLMLNRSNYKQSFKKLESENSPLLVTVCQQKTENVHLPPVGRVGSKIRSNLRGSRRQLTLEFVFRTRREDKWSGSQKFRETGNCLCITWQTFLSGNSDNSGKWRSDWNFDEPTAPKNDLFWLWKCKFERKALRWLTNKELWSVKR